MDNQLMQFMCHTHHRGLKPKFYVDLTLLESYNQTQILWVCCSHVTLQAHNNSLIKMLII